MMNTFRLHTARQMEKTAKKYFWPDGQFIYNIMQQWHICSLYTSSPAADIIALEVSIFMAILWHLQN